NKVRAKGHEEKYDALLKENELLFKMDIMKEKLTLAYAQTEENKMSAIINEIVELCEETGNKHFKWFKRLLLNHYEGIIAHATIRISSGKIEGINNKIKTIRRMGYGYPDDEYFFLKLFDMSRVSYTRNQKSHRICD
ncbi:MAG: transposase, partial [Erysipelotrichaceae bacterium]